MLLLVPNKPEELDVEQEPVFDLETEFLETLNMPELKDLDPLKFPIIKHMAGFCVKNLKKKLQCDYCKTHLNSSITEEDLTAIKSDGFFKPCMQKCRRCL